MDDFRKIVLKVDYMFRSNLYLSIITNVSDFIAPNFQSRTHIRSTAPAAKTILKIDGRYT